MTFKEKYNSIDQSKLPENAKSYMADFKKDSDNFTNKQAMALMMPVLDRFIKGLKDSGYGDAIKGGAKKETKKAETPKEMAKEIVEEAVEQPETKTGKPKVGKISKGDFMKIAKEIRKEGESWNDAMKRAGDIIRTQKEVVKKEATRQYEKLKKFIEKHPEVYPMDIPVRGGGFRKTTINRDAPRVALPKGKRVSRAGWKNQYGKSDGGNKYYEYRSNRYDTRRQRYPFLAKGGEVDAIFAKGGKIEYIHKNNQRENLTFQRYNGAIGQFMWWHEKRYNWGIIYPLDNFDIKYYSHLKLKPNEVILRYRTDTMIGDVKYLVKFNLQKLLVYFMDSDKMSDDDDKNIIFQGRGLQIENMILDWDKLDPSQQMNVNYAKGGELDINQYADNTERYSDILNEYETTIVNNINNQIKYWQKNNDESMVEMLSNDLKNHLSVIEYMREGFWNAAYDEWRNMDTSSREEITNRAYELLMEKNNLPTYAKGGEVGEIRTLWRIKGNDVEMVKKGTSQSIKRFYNSERKKHLRGEKSILDDGAGVQEWYEDTTKEEVLRHRRGYSATSQEYAKGGEIKMGDNVHIIGENKSGFVTNVISHGKHFTVKFIDGTQTVYDKHEIEKILDEGDYDEYAKGGKMSANEHFRLRGFEFLKDDLETLQQAIQNNDDQEIQKFFSYWGQHLNMLETDTNERMYNFLVDDLANLEKAVEENNQEEIDKFFSYWYQHLENLKYAKGGRTNVSKSKTWKQEWTNTKGENGYDILEIVDTDYFSNRYSGGKVVRSKIIESSKPERVGKIEENSKIEMRKIFAGKYPFAYPYDEEVMMAKGGYTAKGEDYEYVNTFGITQPDFEEIVEAWHKGNSLRNTDRINSRLVFRKMENKYGEDKIEEVSEYIMKTHEGHEHYAKGGEMGKLDAGVYRVGKPKKVSPYSYEQKIVEIFENGDISTASDYARKAADFHSLSKYPVISEKQLEAQYKYAEGGLTENSQDYFKHFDLNEEGNFAATIDGNKYEIIYRDDVSQLYDLFKNGKLDNSSRNLRGLMKFAKGGSISKRTTYVPNRDVKELMVVLKGELTKLKGKDILDGVYVKNNRKPAGNKNAAKELLALFKKEAVKKSYGEVGIDESDIEKLFSAGLSEQDVKNVLLGYSPSSVKADTEFGSTIEGIISYVGDYQKKKIDEIVTNVKNGYYEIGLKYPEGFDWKEIVNKYKISKTPKIIEIKKSMRSEKCEIYLGDGVVIGHTTAYKWKGDRKWSEPDVYGELDSENPKFENGYWGIVTKKKEDMYFIVDTLLKQSKGYVKDIALFNNNLGGIGSDEVANEKFRKGGKIGFKGLSEKVAKYYANKSVPSKYQTLYGKKYDKAEAKEVGDKVAAKVYRQQQAKK